MEISLTQEDIARGCPNSITHCAFSLAIRRATGSVHVFVYNNYVIIDEQRYELSKEIRMKLIDYYMFDKIEPFSFYLV